MALTFAARTLIACGLVLLILVAGCTAERSRSLEVGYEECYLSSNPVIFHSADSTTYCGVLSFAGVQKFQELQLRDKTTVNLVSGGGEALAALLFAENVNAGTHTLRFDSVCVSACLYAMLNAASIEISPGGIFVVHASFASKLDFFFSDIANYKASLSAQEIQDAENYKSSVESKIVASGKTFTKASIELLDPVCMVPPDDNFQIANMNEYIRFAYAYWIPVEDTILRWRGTSRTKFDDESYDHAIRAKIIKSEFFFRRYVFDKTLRPLVSDKETILIARQNSLLDLKSCNFDQQND